MITTTNNEFISYVFKINRIIFKRIDNIDKWKTRLIEDIVKNYFG